jgi:hypothetical protein
MDIDTLVVAAVIGGLLALGIATQVKSWPVWMFGYLLFVLAIVALGARQLSRMERPPVVVEAIR